MQLGKAAVPGVTSLTSDAAVMAVRRSAIGLAGVARSDSGEGWRELINALPVAIYTTDEAGRITFYNEAAAALWGRRPTLGEDWWCGSWRLYWPDGRPMSHEDCPMALALKLGRPIRGVEAVAERPDGSRFPFVPYPTPLYDVAGNLVGAVNMLVDVTEQKRAERVGQRLVSIVESSDDAIVGKDLDGIVDSWNAGAERLFGYTAEEMIGRPISTLIPLDRRDEESAILERIRRGERVDHYETVRMRKDGSLVEVSLSVSPIRNEVGNIVGASKIARDITEGKQAQARQELLARELQHRTKNLFSVLHSVISRSFAGKSSVSEAKTAILGRLRALAETHVMLSGTDWHGADLAQVVRTEMGPYMGRVTIEGPPVILSAQVAQSFALVLHELATNAAKYGALSNLRGSVDIRWSVFDRDGDCQFRFHWQERGGPPVKPPMQTGFGSVVLEQVMTEYFDTLSGIRFGADGVSYELQGSLATITKCP